MTATFRTRKAETTKGLKVSSGKPTIQTFLGPLFDRRRFDCSYRVCVTIKLTSVLLFAIHVACWWMNFWENAIIRKQVMRFRGKFISSIRLWNLKKTMILDLASTCWMLGLLNQRKPSEFSSHDSCMDSWSLGAPNGSNGTLGIPLAVFIKGLPLKWYELILWYYGME